MLVTIIGAGYVGLTTAVAMAYLGHDVVSVDKDLSKLDLLKKGISPIYESGIQDLLRKSKKIQFTDDGHGAISKSDVILIAVGTPSKPDGNAEVRYVEEAVLEVARGFQKGRSYTLVIKSTVPIGTNMRVSYLLTRELVANGSKISVSVASNPEFLREGLSLRDTFYPDRIVVGADHVEAIDTLRLLYQPILEQTFIPPDFLPRPEGYKLPPLITTDPTSAEMIKYTANSFLAVKISFINEIAGLCERVGADVTEVARGIGLDPRIGPHFLQAGLGWGGSCFPKDMSALLSIASEYAYSMPVAKAACEVNHRQYQTVLEKLQAELKVLRGRVIGVLGLAFKPNTDDVRQAPAISVIKDLLERGAYVRAHDPIAVANAQKVLDGYDVEYAIDPQSLAEGCDALVLATEWEIYRKIDFASVRALMKIPLLIDARNFLSPDEVRRAGIKYLGVGR